ncbi:MAG: hypothetical protein ACLFM7_02510 [Bacteroidales bacterium]
MQAYETFSRLEKTPYKHAGGFLGLRKHHASMREVFSALKNIMQACMKVSNPFESAMQACAMVSELRNILMNNKITEFLICTVKPFDITGLNFNDPLFANCKLPIAN